MENKRHKREPEHKKHIYTRNRSKLKKEKKNKIII